MAGKPPPKRGGARPARTTKPAKTAGPKSPASRPTKASARPLGSPRRPAATKTPGPAPVRPAGNTPNTGEGPRKLAIRRPARPAGPRPAPKSAPKAGLARPKAAKPPEGERLQKLLAHAGIDSRRKCEELILEGRVHVNGVLVTELGTRADPRRDEITVDFVPIARERAMYILLNKPKGYITTVKDEEGRPTVMALLHGVETRVYPVGRLDFNTEGLLLMTNDGGLANRLMKPDHEVPKVYLAKVHRTPTKEQLDELREGFRLDGRRLKPCTIEIAEKGDNPWLRIILTEGKNLQIRRMFEAIGHPVSKLRRIQFGPLADPALKPGEWRFLSPQEIAAITSL